MLNSLAVRGVWITGGTGKLLWKKALATAVLAITTAVLINVADPAHLIYSWDWFKHTFVTALVTTVVMEAKYWRDWAAKILGNGNGENK